jgi:hypothetical protein
MSVDQLQRKALAQQVIVDGFHDYRTAMQSAAITNFLGTQPQRAYDALIERSIAINTNDAAGKRKAQVSDVGTAGVMGVARQVNTDARHRLYQMRGFLKRFALDRLLRKLRIW